MAIWKPYQEQMAFSRIAEGSEYLSEMGILEKIFKIVRQSVHFQAFHFTMKCNYVCNNWGAFQVFSPENFGKIERLNGNWWHMVAYWQGIMVPTLTRNRVMKMARNRPSLTRNRPTLTRNRPTLAPLTLPDHFLINFPHFLTKLFFRDLEKKRPFGPRARRPDSPVRPWEYIYIYIYIFSTWPF